MNYLKIENKGALDMRLVSLMGGTTKANDKFKIGQFGTGLKYTLAYLVRENIDFHIAIDGKKIKVGVEKEIIRNEEFEIICINGHRTSITTRMGLEWEAWMIVRELWCNALDEGEAKYSISSDIELPEGKTVFYIQNTGAIKDVFDNWNKYFITQEPIEQSKNWAIYEGGKSLRVYKNGILIHENDRCNALFSYDIKDATINEMREYKGVPSNDITSVLRSISKETVDLFIANVVDGQYEYDMDMDWGYGYTKFGQGWKDAIGNANIITQKSKDDIESRGIKIDTVGTIVLPPNLNKQLSDSFEGISALRVADANNDFYETISEKAQTNIKTALQVLEDCGYTYHPELTFVYGEFGNTTTLASVSMDKKTVFISIRFENFSIFQAVSMLIEECEHFKTGLEDCSRGFQQHFIDLYTKTLLDKNSITL